MNGLTSKYKQALLEARDAFSAKYSESVEASIDDIAKRYHIAADSNLVSVLHVGMKKLLLGLDYKAEFFESLLNANSESLDDRKRLGDYPVFESEFEALFKQLSASDELDKFFRVGKGQNRVLMHTLSLIQDNQSDIGNDPAPDTIWSIDKRVLGSLIKQTISAYSKANGSELLFAFAKVPEHTYDEISSMHSSILNELSQG